MISTTSAAGENQTDPNTDWDEDQTAEVRRLANAIQYNNKVSVAFKSRNKCTRIKQSALFDSGSPACFVKRSLVPFNGSTNLTEIGCKGMGGKRLSTYGSIECEVEFKGKHYKHFFFILPDEEAVVPILIGRDLMHAMNICLCQIEENNCTGEKKISYSRNLLLNLRNKIKINETETKISDALKSYDLSKSPQKRNVNTEVPTEAKTKCTKNTTETRDKNKMKSELFIGVVNFDKKKSMKDIEEVIETLD